MNLRTIKFFIGALVGFLFVSKGLAQVERTDDYFARGDWKRAVEGFHARGLQNLSGEELKRAALSLYFLKRSEEAFEIIKPLVNRGDTEAEVIYALLLSETGRRVDAINRLKRINTPWSLTALAMIFKKEKPDEALGLLNEAIARDSNNFWAWFYRGLILEEREEFLEASKAYKNAIRINPFFAQAHNNLGYCYKELHYYTYAVEEYLRAIELMPENAGFYYNLGNAYTHLERIDDAFNAYKKAIEFDPQFAKAHYNLGRTYLRKDMVREAIEEFRLYIKYGNKEVFEFVAPKESVLEEIEQLEEYLRLYGPPKGKND